ncbi:MAG TPA: sodium:proton antiporter, partial [Desulfobacteraceae bacterium]|nr:sodium:proton antiporter [Desulfobacteraceae bacterium]
MHVSPHYLQKSMEETSVPNVVTAVLADYRGFDTMFETTVIFCAGVACFMLLRISRQTPEDRYYRHISTGVTIHIKGGGKIPDKSKEFERIDTMWTPFDLVIKTVCRFLIPFIQLFALYVIAHGHHSPGGGFQGGVILGASIILLAISHNLRTATKRMNEKLIGLLCATGVFLYAGTGALCLLMGL